MPNTKTNKNTKLLYQSISFENSPNSNELFLGIDKNNNKYFYQFPIIKNKLIKNHGNTVRIFDPKDPENNNYFVDFNNQPDFWKTMGQLLYKTPFTNIQFLNISDYINGFELLLKTYNSIKYGSFIKRIAGTPYDFILNQNYKPDPEFSQEFFNKKILPVYKGLTELIVLYYQQNTLSKEEFENWINQ